MISLEAHSALQTVNNISPLSYCRGTRPDITLIGSDLDANLNEDLANCRFRDEISGTEFSKQQSCNYSTVMS